MKSIGNGSEENRPKHYQSLRKRTAGYRESTENSLSPSFMKGDRSWILVFWMFIAIVLSVVF